MKVVPLAVAGAFHTSIMQPADQRLATALSGVTLKRPRMPVVSNVDAQPHDEPEEIRRLLVQQLIQAGALGRLAALICWHKASSDSTKSAPGACSRDC